MPIVERPSVEPAPENAATVAGPVVEPASTTLQVPPVTEVISQERDLPDGQAIPALATPVAEGETPVIAGNPATAGDHITAATVQEPVILGSEWLALQNEQAWRGIAALWQQESHASAIKAACDGQPRMGYACLRDQGSWSRVQKLGLPVILVLQQEGTHRVLLRGIDGNGLLLGAGEDALLVDREQVDPMWLGEYFVAWPQAPDWPPQIRRGESGTAVDIVLRMATQAEPAWKGGGVFDDSFETWLKAFQENNGLTVDGIIGPKTLLYLMAPTIAEPRLESSGFASF